MTTAVRPAAERETLTRAAAERFAASSAVSQQFFDANADAIARACHAMAGRFQKGGRLFVCGDGAQRSDVAHVVVEFLHPVVVGKRALPAIPLPDMAGGAAQRGLDTMARSGDLLMVLCAGAPEDCARELLAAAQADGLLTLALIGQCGESSSLAYHVFEVSSFDPCIVQETHEMLYHVLWELVHVFFEHRAVNA